MSNGNSTGTGLRPIPAKICDVTAFSCTSAGADRGSNAGSRRRPEKRERRHDRGLGTDLGPELIERGMPFDAHGRNRGRPEFVGGETRSAGDERRESCQQTRDEPDSLHTQCVAPRRQSVSLEPQSFARST